MPNRRGFWDAVAIYDLRATLFLLGAVFSLVGSGCSAIQPLFVGKGHFILYLYIFLFYFFACAIVHTSRGQLLQTLPTTTNFTDIRYLFFEILLFMGLGFLSSSIGAFLTSVASARATRDLRDVIFRGAHHCWRTKVISPQGCSGRSMKCSRLRTWPDSRYPPIIAAELSLAGSHPQRHCKCPRSSFKCHNGGVRRSQQWRHRHYDRALHILATR